jgi:hypothetical protein
LRSLSRHLTAAVLATALTSGGVVTAGAAFADDAPACTVTAVQQTAARDAATTLSALLKGHKPTEAERTALRAAVVELVRTAKDAKLSATAKAAKRAEFRALAASLETATTAEQRTAIRAEMRAIAVVLKDAKLTKAERAELKRKIKEMRRALTGRVTGAERAAAQAQLKTLKAQLGCTVVG